MLFSKSTCLEWPGSREESFTHSCHSERSEESLLGMELDSFVAMLLKIIHAGWRHYHSPRKWAIRVTPIFRRKDRSLMPGCGGHRRFLAALQRKGWCRNDGVRPKVGDSIFGATKEGRLGSSSHPGSVKPLPRSQTKPNRPCCSLCRPEFLESHCLGRSHR